jgi:hypothetical protein
MVNIKAIVTIDKNETIVVHKNWPALQRWEFDNAPSDEIKNKLASKVANFNQQTTTLERQHSYPVGSLDGLRIITGSAEGLDKKLKLPEFRNLLTDPRNAFVIKIRQGDAIIRTSIHTPDKLIEWEHIDIGRSVISWPKQKR